MIVLVTLFLLWVLSWYVRFYWKWRKGPPGPIPIPVLGNLIQMGIAGIGVPTPNLAISKLTSKYGSIFRLSIGVTDYSKWEILNIEKTVDFKWFWESPIRLWKFSTTDSETLPKNVIDSMLYLVVLGSYDAMADIRNRKEAQGRHLLGLLWDRNEGRNTGIALSEGHFHETTKKFVFHNLHKLGLNKAGGLEGMVQATAASIVKDWRVRLDDRKCAVIDDLPRIGRYAARIVTKFFLGEELLDSPKYQTHFDKLVQAAEEWLHAGVFGAGLDQAFPFLRHIFPWLVQKEITERTVAVPRQMAQDLLEDLRKNSREKSKKPSPGDISSLAEIYLEKIESKADPSIFSDYHFQTAFMDVFQASSESQSATQRALLLFCILHPEAQSRIWQEIQSVVGKNDPVMMEHRKSMPFTESFMIECARHMMIAPHYVPSKLMSDIRVGEWVIPKGTGVFCDVHSVHFNTTDWDRPEEFDPHRFLTQEGSRTKKLVAPFGIGRRSCPGELLGDTMAFIFFVSFLKAFKVSAVPGREPPRFEVQVGMAFSPVPFDMMIQERVW